MNCIFCGREIVETREGYYVLNGFEYHNKKKYAYIEIVLDDEDVDEETKKEIINEENEIVYCEDCYSTRVNIKPG